MLFAEPVLYVYLIQLFDRGPQSKCMLPVISFTNNALGQFGPIYIHLGQHSDTKPDLIIYMSSGPCDSRRAHTLLLELCYINCKVRQETTDILEAPQEVAMVPAWLLMSCTDIMKALEGLK